MALSEDEEAFAAIVGRIGDDEDLQYRRRALASLVVLLFGSAVVVGGLAVWQSAWGAVVGLPLMVAADVTWIVTLRRSRRWRGLASDVASPASVPGRRMKARRPTGGQTP